MPCVMPGVNEPFPRQDASCVNILMHYCTFHWPLYAVFYVLCERGIEPCALSATTPGEQINVKTIPCMDHEIETVSFDLSVSPKESKQK